MPYLKKALAAVLLITACALTFGALGGMLQGQWPGALACLALAIGLGLAARRLWRGQRKTGADTATQTGMQRRRGGAMALVAVAAFGAGIWWLMPSRQQVEVRAQAATQPAKDQLIDNPNTGDVASYYGMPDKDSSTAYDSPRPPLVTRFLEYRKERVRFVFMPKADVGAPPPYANWQFIGAQDTATNAKLSLAEADARLSARHAARANSK